MLYQRERDLFINNRDASVMYSALKNGDPVAISGWIHARFGKTSERHPILMKADDDTASLLCQKLLKDDIDLTKRSDLFYHLRNITRDKNGLRDLILNIFAYHIHNTSVMNKFITIAGSLYISDPVVRKAIFLLTDSENSKIRESAFLALARTKFFIRHIHELRKSFMMDSNRDFRKRLLMASATFLGRAHLSAINLSGSMGDVPLAEVLDTHEMLNADLADQIVSQMKKREKALEAEMIARDELDSNNKSIVRNINARAIKLNAVIHNAKSIIEKQEEVMSHAAVIRLFFWSEHPERAQAAANRIRLHN